MAAPTHMPHIVETDGLVIGRCSCGAQGPTHTAGPIGEHLARKWATGHAGLIHQKLEVARLATKPQFAFEMPRASGAY